jgi:hypothetical protein
LYCDGRSPLYAGICRRLADDPQVGGLAPDLGWDLPLRLLGGLHYLVLRGDAWWDDLDGALVAHASFLGRWCVEQDVQTNEVQRSWALLPAFLSLADGRPFDLLELGPSAGLNLLWDRYRYRYASGTWGSGSLELAGEDRVSPPAALFTRSVEVVRRRGVDLSPVDVTTEHGALVLQSFVWADQTARLERLRRAIETVRQDPPELVGGDYVEALPALLRERADDALLLVFQTASTMYLDRGQNERLHAALRDGGRTAPFVYVTTGRAPRDDGYALEVHRYPDGSSERLAVFDFHGEWLDWGR